MRYLIAAVLLFSLAVTAFAAGDQAYLGMFAETSLMKMAGMPAIELPPGVDLEQMGNVPGMADMMAMGSPKRAFTIRLWSPGTAPADATAYVAPPAGLKQGDKLDLEIARPKPAVTDGAGSGTDGSGAGSTDFTIKYYWGSSPTVKPGQPKVFSMNALTPDQKRMMREQAKIAQGGKSLGERPDWTTAHWPTPKQPGKIAKDASLVGNYSLTTSYTGNVTIDCPTNVDFLAPIDMVSPKLEKTVPLDGAIAFQWKPIPNLLGSHAVITGMEGRNTVIIWNSSEVWREDMMSIDWDYMQMAQVRELVAATIMMKGDRTNVTVPAGIFKDCDMVSMMMIGYGPGAARADVSPVPRIQTKTTLNLMLGGKQMEGMGDMGDMDIGERDEE